MILPKNPEKSFDKIDLQETKIEELKVFFAIEMFFNLSYRTGFVELDFLFRLIPFSISCLLL